MRPRASVCTDSVKTIPAPPAARAARCAKCQSFITPSFAEYWHIGESMIRFLTVTDRIVKGRNK